MASEKGDACYVCHETASPTDRSACACKAFVHKQCLAKLLVRNASDKCPICKRTMTNVGLRPEWRLQCSAVAFFKLSGVASGLVLTGISVWFVAIACIGQSSHSGVQIACAATFEFMAIVGCALSQYLQHRFGNEAQLVLKRNVYRVSDELV